MTKSNEEDGFSHAMDHFVLASYRTCDGLECDNSCDRLDFDTLSATH